MGQRTFNDRNGSFLFPATVTLGSGDDLLDVGAIFGTGQEPRDSPEVGARRGREYALLRLGESDLASLFKDRAFSPERGTFVGQGCTDHADASSCSGQEPTIRLRVYGNNIPDLPAMTFPDMCIL
jgi:hypothetical protein